MPSARKRSNPLALPKFATSFKPQRKKAWIDRVELSLKGGRIHNAPPSTLMSHFRRVATDGSPFRRPSLNKDQDRIQIDLAKGWLFGGRINIRASSEGQWHDVDLVLKLNLTRFVQHQGFGEWARRGARSGWAVLRPMEGNALAAQRENLAASDNLISSDKIQDAIGANWADMLLEHVRIVLRCLDWYANEGVYSTNLRTAFVNLNLWRTWTVRQLEVYWEAKGDDAVSYAHTVSKNTKAIADTLDYREYKGAEGVMRTEKNSPSVNVRVAKDIRLAVYAKADDRIRFEVRYDARVRQAIGVLTGQADHGHIANISDFVVCAIDDAHERFSRVLPELTRTSVSGHKASVALARVLSSISRACGGDLFLTHKIIMLLLNNGGISITTGDQLSPAVERLAAEKMLVRARTRRRESSRRYQLADPMRSTIRRIADAIE